MLLAKLDCATFQAVSPRPPSLPGNYYPAVLKDLLWAQVLRAQTIDGPGDTADENGPADPVPSEDGRRRGLRDEPLPGNKKRCERGGVSDHGLARPARFARIRRNAGSGRRDFNSDRGPGLIPEPQAKF